MVSHVDQRLEHRSVRSADERARQALAAADVPGSARQVASRPARHGHRRRRADPRVPRAGHRLRPRQRGPGPRAERVAWRNRASPTPSTAPPSIVHSLVGIPVCRLDLRRDLTMRAGTAMNVLVFNCGSSSLKYRLITMPAARGAGRRRGPAGGPADRQALRHHPPRGGDARRPTKSRCANHAVGVRAGDAPARTRVPRWCRTPWDTASSTAATGSASRRG